MIKDIESNPSFKFLNMYEKHALILGIFFHDIIYVYKIQNTAGHHTGDEKYEHDQDAAPRAQIFRFIV